MSEIKYLGTKQSISDITYLLTQAGYTVTESSPNSPKAASEFWVKARELFPKETVEAGGLRDYRAVIETSSGEKEFLRVPVSSVVFVDNTGNVQVGTESGTKPLPDGISVWQDNQSGSTIQAFLWDGTDLGFSDLIAFFQVSGNMLNQLVPEPGPDGFPQLQGKATLVSTQRVYEFTMTRQTLFAQSPSGTIEVLTVDQLSSGFTRIK